MILKNNITDNASSGDSLKTPILKSVDKAFEILECYNSDNSSYTLKELALRLDVSKGTVHRILLTAQKRGIIEQNSETGRYQLGIKLFELGSIVAGRMDLRRESLPIMRKMAEQTGETLYLTIRSGDEALCVERVEGKNFVKVLILDVGKRMPLNIGGGPKVLLAHMSDSELESWIERAKAESWTANSIIDPDKIRAEAAVIRRCGYAISFEDVVIGAAAIGAPIKRAGGKMIAAVSIAGASYNYREERMESLIKATVEAGNDISVRMGYY